MPFVFLLCLTFMVPAVLPAQQSPASSSSTTATSVSLAKLAVFRLEHLPVTMTPATIELDSTHRTATLRITNTYRDTVAVKTWLRFAVPSGPRGGLVATDSAADDSAAAEAQRLDSLAGLWSLETWVRKIPGHIILAPNQTVTQPIALSVPKNLSPGEYSAYLILTMSMVTALPGHPKLPDGTDVPEAMLKKVPPGWRGEEGNFMDMPIDKGPSPAFVKIVYRVK